MQTEFIKLAVIFIVIMVMVLGKIKACGGGRPLCWRWLFWYCIWGGERKRMINQLVEKRY